MYLVQTQLIWDKSQYLNQFLKSISRKNIKTKKIKNLYNCIIELLFVNFVINFNISIIILNFKI